MFKAHYYSILAALAMSSAAFPSFAQEAEKIQVDNPYGLEALWASGDLVSRSTLIIMAVMSLGTWYIMFTKFYEQSRIFAAAKDAGEKFWAAKKLDDGAKSLKEGSPFRFVAENGLKSIQHHDGALLEQIDLHTWVSLTIQRAVEQISNDLQGGLAFLATVGSTAPFIGLFGTVVGIYRALTAIGISGQASIDKVAGPVGEALIMTAFGLATAVPAVLGYNFLVRRNKSALEKIRNFGSDLHEVLLAAARKTSKGA